MKRGRKSKKLYAVEVLFGEPDFLSFLLNTGRKAHIPSKVYYRMAYSPRQAQFLVDRLLEGKGISDYEVISAQEGDKGDKFGPFTGRGNLTLGSSHESV